jgi:hypothetical protein
VKEKQLKKKYTGKRLAIVIPRGFVRIVNLLDGLGHLTLTGMMGVMVLILFHRLFWVAESA